MHCTRLRILTTLVLILLFIAPFPAMARGAPDVTDVLELEAFMAEVITAQMDQHNVPGVTLSIVRDGEIILARGYGYADLDQRIPVDPDRTLFRPGSVSKLFTWTAVLQLVERGVLDLDADINTYLDFDLPDRIVSNGRSSPEPITMRHLLTHTPGFENVGQGLFVLSADELISLDEFLQIHMPARVFEPGTILAYSNYGTALAGYIVEQVSGMPFEDYIEQYVFAPLDIRHSTFRQPLPDHLAPQMTRAYRYADGQFHEAGFEYVPPVPAGAMSSTSTDMARFMIAQLQEGRYGEERILEPETVREMHRQQFTGHPAVPGVTLGLFEEYINGNRVLAHSGGTLLFYSLMYLLPDQDLGLFVSYSGGDDQVWQLPGELFQEFMDRYYPHSRDPVPAPPAGARDRAAEFAGEYHPAAMSYTGPDKFLGLLQAVRVGISKDGYLTGNFMGRSIKFVEVELGVYRNTDTDNWPAATIAFTDGPGGRPAMAAGASTFIRAPWYETLPFLGWLVLVALLLMTATLLGWLVAAVARRIRRQATRHGRGGQLARLVAAAMSIVTVVFFVGMGVIFTDIDPAYVVPNIIFGVVTPGMQLIFALPWAMIPLGVAMLYFTVAAWRHRYWTRLVRVHYTLLTVSVLGLLWVLTFTNMFS